MHITINCKAYLLLTKTMIIEGSDVHGPLCLRLHVSKPAVFHITSFVHTISSFKHRKAIQTRVKTTAGYKFQFRVWSSITQNCSFCIINIFWGTNFKSFHQISCTISIHAIKKTEYILSDLKTLFFIVCYFY